MKLYKWLNDPFSARVGLAIIEVEPGETADIEAMARIIDGDTVGHFGISAKLLTEDNPPGIQTWGNLGNKRGVESFGHDPIRTYPTRSRFYEVHVSRD